LFEKAAEFIPDRFEHTGERDPDCNVKAISEEELRQKKRNAEFMPFSFGRRACIGAFFGEMVVKIMLRSLIRRFEWKADGNTDKKIAIFGLEMKTCKLLIRPLSGDRAF
jgi:cytochrome P450